jgi:PKD repeat protein
MKAIVLYHDRKNSFVLFLVTLIFICLGNILWGQCTGTTRVAAEFTLFKNDICEGQEITIQNTTIENGHTRMMYIMNWGDGTKPDTVYQKQEMKHTYKLDDLDPCIAGSKDLELRLDAIPRGCTNFKHFVIKPAYVNLKPRPKFIAQQQECGSLLSIVNQSCPTSELNYAWDFGDLGASGNTQFTQTPVFAYQKPGNYVIQLTATNVCGSFKTSQSITVQNRSLQADFKYTLDPQMGCVITPIVSFKNTSTGANRIKWEISPEDITKWQFTQLNMNDDSDEISLRFFKAGDYRITLKALNACQQENNKQVFITIPTPPALNNKILSLRDTICPGDTLTLSLNNPAQRYNWSTGLSTSRIQVKPNQTTTYSLDAEFTNGCKTKFEKTVVVTNTLLVQINLLEDKCQYNLQASPSLGRAPYTYSWSNGATSPLLRNPIVGQYKVQIWDRYSCSSSSSFNLEKFTLFDGPPQVDNPGCSEADGQIRLQLRSGRTPYLLEWSPSNLGLGENPRIQLSAGVYSATVVDGSGCVDSVRVLLEQLLDCSDGFDIFKSFTPNGDGPNDNLIIRAKPSNKCPSGDLSECYPNHLVLVYNRNGEVIFQGRHYQSNWSADRFPAGEYVLLFYLDRKDPNTTIFKKLTILK